MAESQWGPSPPYLGHKAFVRADELGCQLFSTQKLLPLQQTTAPHSMPPPPPPTVSAGCTQSAGSVPSGGHSMW